MHTTHSKYQRDNDNIMTARSSLLRSDRDGMSTSTALALPVIAALIMGGVECGRMTWAHSILQFAAEQTAFWSQGRLDAAPPDIIRHAAQSIAGIPTTSTNPIMTVSDDRRLTLTYRYRPLTPEILHPWTMQAGRSAAVIMQVSAKLP